MPQTVRYLPAFCLLTLGSFFYTTTTLSRTPDGAKSPAAGQTARRQSGSPPDVFGYISASWGDLTRSLDDCRTYSDVKVKGEPILYLPFGLETPPAVAGLKQHCKVRVDHLPEKITRAGEVDPSRIGAEGLLYLEHPYVVPGGQFNEMYGWDSYFIIRGLLRESRRELAKGMVENFFFEIEHYGGVLNANRTYYLTRSQPPFLTSMILAVYEADKDAGASRSAMARKGLWLCAFAITSSGPRTPHLAGDTGLSRYFDHGEGPVPEIMGDPSHYYRGAAQYFLQHEGGRAPSGACERRASLLRPLRQDLPFFAAARKCRTEPAQTDGLLAHRSPSP